MADSTQSDGETKQTAALIARNSTTSGFPRRRLSCTGNGPTLWFLWYSIGTEFVNHMALFFLSISMNWTGHQEIRLHSVQVRCSGNVNLILPSSDENKIKKSLTKKLHQVSRPKLIKSKEFYILKWFDLGSSALINYLNITTVPEPPDLNDLSDLKCIQVLHSFLYDLKKINALLFPK